MASGWTSGRRRPSANPEGVVRKHHGDRLILIFTVLLMFVGLLIIYAIGPQRANLMNSLYGYEYSDSYFFLKQLLSVGLALGGFWFASVIPFNFVLKHGTKVLWIGFIACALLAIGGWTHIIEGTNGAVRWIELGPLGSVQPAEVLKLGVLLYLATFLGIRSREKKMDDLYQTLIPVAILAGAALLFVIVIQKDLGTGIFAERNYFINAIRCWYW